MTELTHGIIHETLRSLPHETHERAKSGGRAARGERRGARRGGSNRTPPASAAAPATAKSLVGQAESPAHPHTSLLKPPL